MKICEVLNKPSGVLQGTKFLSLTPQQTIQVQPDAVKRDKRIAWVVQLLANKDQQKLMPSKEEILAAFARYDEMQQKANADYAMEKKRKREQAEWDNGCLASGTTRPLR